MKIFRFATVFSVIFLNGFFLLSTFLPKINARQSISAFPLSDNKTQSAVKYQLIKPIRDEEISAETNLNLLLLGLDSRKNESNPRCDAIHIFSYSPSTDYLTITSIPRGTRVEINNVSTQSAYLANSCHIKGIEATIEEIEKISGLNIDAYVTVGFSQVLGILRQMKLPTTPTLQYLRNRKYGIGDYQRSHNQAIFLKDMLIEHNQILADMPDRLKKWLYSIIKTNLSYQTADQIFSELYKKNVLSNPDKIILITKPEKSKYTKELHYDQNPENESDWQDDSEFIEYQNDLENYLKRVIAGAIADLTGNRKLNALKKVETIYRQKLWMQIEDEETRDNLHFDLFRIYFQSADDPNFIKALKDDYIEEMDLFDKTKFIKQAEGLKTDQI